MEKLPAARGGVRESDFSEFEEGEVGEKDATRVVGIRGECRIFRVLETSTFRRFGRVPAVVLGFL